MKKAALVIMAAGMASRYGGNKQVDGMGPNGEILMEYSIMDAMRAGFTKVVFIIKRNMVGLMKEICGKKYEGKIEVCYACQEFDSVPGEVPEGRVKPFGTVHAALCARKFVDEPFAVINADDYYGVESFGQMFDFLMTLEDGQAAMMGYRLGNTVSKNGTVTRGICQVEDGDLVGVREVKRIQLVGDRILDLDTGEELDKDASVSMNFWGFGSGMFEMMDARFRVFLSEIEDGDLTKEFLLPVCVDALIQSGELKVKVLPTKAQWFGVTYKEDRNNVVKELAWLHEKGVY